MGDRPAFGTSGLRGRVVDLTPDLVAAYIRAFIASGPTGGALWVGRDLRPSSPDLAAVVLEAARATGLVAVDCGAVPTPALALAAGAAGAAAVMVTGSHIPADRNGLKFYRPMGEITKADEAALLAALAAPLPPGPAGPPVQPAPDVGAEWVARVVASFGAGALAGLRLGVWAHSSVARDLLAMALIRLGAGVVELGRSDHFIPVDTEAVDAAIRAQLAAWAQEHRLDGIVSTDGDGDRPLLADAAGVVVPGDILGQITAAQLGAQVVVTPVSSNSGVEQGGRFEQVVRTRIGSPHVIAGMMAAGPGARVVGYEANGGFLLGFAAQGPAGALAPLVTRDSLLPLVAVLAAARAAGGVAVRVAAEPARFTAADRLQGISVDRAGAFLAGLQDGGLAGFLAALDEQPAEIDTTDGLRMTLVSGRVLHLRPSGNAPEFRLYTEAGTRAAATALLRHASERVAACLAAPGPDGSARAP